MRRVSRVIALEEAFLHPRLWEFYSVDLQRRCTPVKERLSDVGPGRLAAMDVAGIDLHVLSHVQPGSAEHLRFSPGHLGP
jgi:hypothetical protein